MLKRVLLACVPLSAALLARPAAADTCIPPKVPEALSACSGVAGLSPPTAHSAAAVPAVAPPEAKARPQPTAAPDPKLSAVAIRRGLATPRQTQLIVTQIQGLETLLASTAASSPDRPGIVRRLADTYVELEAASTTAQIQAQIANNAAVATKNGAVVIAARKAAIRYYEELKAQYPRWCQSPGPPAQGCVDETLYNLAYEHEQAGDLGKARAAYLDLIQAAPGSKFVPNAYLAFGELFFQEAQGDPSKWALAEQSYKEVTRFPAPENKVLAYARYKLAYVYWNKGDYAQGISELKKTIDVGMRFPTVPNAAELANSARRDIIPLYALAGDPKKAHDFFRPISGDGASQSERTLKMTADLGQAYLDVGRYADGIEVYEDLYRRDKGERSCDYQAHVTEAVLALKTGDKPAAKAALDRQLALELRFRGEGHTDAAKRACANATARLAVETAMIWHLEAVGAGPVRGTMSAQTMGLADDLYEKLVKQFTAKDFAGFEFPRIVKQDWPTLLKVKAARADLLYAQKQWEKCGPAFDAVVAEEPSGPLAAESAYVSALCYERALHAANAGKPYRVERGDKALEPRDFTPREAAMVASFDRFLCVAKPDSPDKTVRDNRAEIEYARARMYFEARKWPEAAAAFRVIALDRPDHEAGIFAAQLYLEALNVMRGRGKRECLGDMARDVPQIREKHCAGQKAGANAEQCATLARVQRDVKWQKIDDDVKDLGDKPGHEKEWEAIADGYLELWNEGKAACEGKQPGCERMDDVLYNAARAFQAARLVAKAISVRKIILDPRYNLDRTKVARKATLEIGKNYQAIAVYDEAAAWFERFAKDAASDDRAPEALQDAVVLRLGLGQEEQAYRDAEAFDRAYRGKHAAEAAQIAFAIGAYLAEHDALPEAQRRLRAAMAEIDRSAPIDVQIQAHATLGRVMWKQGGVTGAAAEYAKVRALYKDPAGVAERIKSDDPDQRSRRIAKAVTAVGEALFFDAEQRRKAVDAIQFPAYRGSGRRDDVMAHIRTKVDAWMKRKMPAIEAAEREYVRILELSPSPPPRWVIASGARVGNLWGKFVAEFRAAPVPKEWLQKGPSPYGDLTWEEILYRYWEELDRVSEPYKQRAKIAYQKCLSYSSRYQFFDDHSRSCEVWLSKNYGAEFHVIDELRAAPSRIANRAEPQPVVLAKPEP